MSSACVVSVLIQALFRSEENNQFWWDCPTGFRCNDYHLYWPKIPFIFQPFWRLHKIHKPCTKSTNRGLDSCDFQVCFFVLYKLKKCVVERSWHWLVVMFIFPFGLIIFQLYKLGLLLLCIDPKHCIVWSSICASWNFDSIQTESLSHVCPIGGNTDDENLICRCQPLNLVCKWHQHFFLISKMKITEVYQQ